MSHDNTAADGADLVEGQVLLPWAGSACLRVQAECRPVTDPVIMPKCAWGGAHARPLAAALGRGARMARLLEPPRQGGIPHLALILSAEPTVTETDAQALTGLLSWTAAAGACADRITRRLALDWARHTVLLAGFDLEEADPQRWGRLVPLPAALEAQALSALHAGPPDAPWATALIVLPGDEARYAAARSALSQRWPKAKVCTADAIAALCRPDGGSARPRVGETWYAAAGAGGAALRRVRVAVSPWQPVRSEAPPVQVVFPPDTLQRMTPEQLRQAENHLSSLLKLWRENEVPAAGLRWSTVLQLPGDFLVTGGHSFELALCLADRMARGREWPGPGRVFATGGVQCGERGMCEVLSVSGTAAPHMRAPDQAAPAAGDLGDNHKLDLFLAEARGGDTVLLPDDARWRAQVVARLGALGDDDTCTTPAGALVAFARQVLP